MKLRVLFFAHLREHIGARETEVDLPAGATAATLKAHLAELYPALAPALPNLVVAVNHEFAADPTPIPEGAEIALFPPVSGG